MAKSACRTIWIINQYASTPATGMGGRHYYLAREMVKTGHRVYLIAAGFTHLLRQPPKMDSDIQIESIEDDFNFVWLRMPEYADAHDKWRIWNWFSFAWKLLKLSRCIPHKPDAIVASSPAPFIFLSAHRLAKKFHARLAFEVRDIWPLSLIEIGGYSSSHPFIRLIQWIEDRAYRQSDVVLSVLPNAREHMAHRGMDVTKFKWIPNGFDSEEVARSESLPQSLIDALPSNKFIVGYAGTLGFANALGCFIDAATLARDDDSIAWVLVGDGKEKDKLQMQVRELGLRNVIFIEPIPKTQIQSMLSRFDASYIGLTRDPLFRFGVSPNKLFEYFYAARPVIYAIDSGDYKPVDDAGAGYSVAAQDAVEILAAVRKLQSMPPEQREQMGARARAYALQNHDYKNLAEELANVLLD